MGLVRNIARAVLPDPFRVRLDARSVNAIRGQSLPAGKLDARPLGTVDPLVGFNMNSAPNVFTLSTQLAPLALLNQVLVPALPNTRLRIEHIIIFAQFDASVQLLVRRDAPPLEARWLVRELSIGEHRVPPPNPTGHLSHIDIRPDVVSTRGARLELVIVDRSNVVNIWSMIVSWRRSLPGKE